jgi:hypothetical protein
LIRRLPPCTETILSGQQPYRSPAKRQSPRKRITLAQHTTVASEHHCHRRDAETSGQTLRWQRPETHQNLIHPDKDLPSGSTRGPAPPFGGTSGVAVPRNHQRRLLSLLRDTVRPTPAPSHSTGWWR